MAMPAIHYKSDGVPRFGAQCDSAMLGFGLIVKLPRLLKITFLFISLCLLVFLMLGGLNPGGGFSGIYIIEYKYNTSSPLYPQIKSSLSPANGTSSNSSLGSANLKIRAGYFYICGDSGNTISCGSKSDPNLLANIGQVSLYSASSNSVEKTVQLGSSKNVQNSVATVDPVQLAKVFSTQVVNPVLLCIALICNVCTLITSLMSLSPSSSPTHRAMSTVCLISLVGAWFFWTIGAIWQQVAALAASTMVNDSSMSIIEGTVGSRASGIAWTVFSFYTLCIGLALLIQRRDNSYLARIGSLKQGV